MRGLSERTEKLIAFAYQTLAANHPMTLRQLHYAIFSASKIDYDNSQSDYKRLSRATTTARRTQRWGELHNVGVIDGIPHDWIIDEVREAERVSMWDNKDEFLQTVKQGYRRDNWKDQPNYVEIWSEKATVLGSLRPITRELGVMLRACRGFGSTGMEGQIGNLFESIDKPITVFYVGDHDPSGHDIERDIHGRAQNAAGKDFVMLRLAIHAEDIKKFKLPPQRIKVTDSRAKGFQRRFGLRAATVELDALPVAELRTRVSDAINNLIEPESWNRALQVQQVEMNCISEFVDRVKNLPRINPA